MDSECIRRFLASDSSDNARLRIYTRTGDKGKLSKLSNVDLLYIASDLSSEREI